MGYDVVPKARASRRRRRQEGGAGGGPPPAGDEVRGEAVSFPYKFRTFWCVNVALLVQFSAFLRCLYGHPNES